MAAPPAIAAASIVQLLLGQALSYEASLRTEARGRAAARSVTTEVEANPRLALNAEGREGTLTGIYTPQLIVFDPVLMHSSSVSLQVLHNAALNGTWRVSPFWSSSAAVYGSYGTRDMLLPAPAGSQPTGDGETGGAATGGSGAPGTGPRGGLPGSTPRAQPLPSTTTLRYVGATLQLGVTGTVDPTMKLRLTAGGTLTGGLDAAARSALPLQRSASAGAALDWSPASYADLYTTSVTTTLSRLTRTDGDIRTDTLTFLLVSWRHAFPRGLQTFIGAGPALATERIAPGDVRLSLRPATHAGLVLPTRAPALETSLFLQVAPLVDGLTGAVYERADAVTSVTWHPGPAWTIGGSATGGVVIEGAQRGDRLAIAAAQVGWSDRRLLGLGAGVRLTMQQPTGGPRFEAWDFFLTANIKSGQRL